jgi:wobble nucleotide-excising tRNase
MISKINKIKNLGLFNDYTPIGTLRDFKKYNLIYGWNGSGKTTLSKLFDALETGAHPDFTDLEYEVQNEGGTKFQQGVVFDQNVRVFNQDYIEKNLQIRDGKAKSITLVLGDVSKEVLEQIESDEVELREKSRELKTQGVQCELKEKQKGNTFTEIAKTIYVAITGGATRNYRKNDAENDFASLVSKELLSDEELGSLAIVVKQVPKPIIDQISDFEVKFENVSSETSLESALNSSLRKAESLLSQKVDSIAIERIKNNTDISEWIEEGLGLHRKHNSDDCEFCGQLIPKNRLDELAKHFNEADKQLKQDIDALLFEYETIKMATKTSSTHPDQARFYDELSDSYQITSEHFADEVTKLLINIEKIQSALKEKKSKTTEAVKNTVVTDTTKLTESLAEVNAIILTHNKKTTDFESAKAEAISKLKKHYLSTIFDFIKNLETEIAEHAKQIQILTSGDAENPDILGINQLKKRIFDNKAKISSTHKACAEINTGLETFLGRNELVFAPHKVKSRDESGSEIEIDDGYIIMRNEKPVTHLSEGEKTAIAFIYFTIHINDTTFNKGGGIVVIDDPISSLDSNSLFQAFSFMKNSVKDVGQVFILTHNFDFLRLLLNWLKHRDIPDREKEFYMIKNCDSVNGRIAFLDTLDKDLKDYESEYHYLFKLLFNFQTDGTIASVYHMPNIARKVLETFLMFRVPNSDNLYEKLESLKGLFDANKITAIYKFTNDQSHITGKGFDPALVPETQNVVRYLLEFIEATFPEHYRVLTTP